MKSYYNIIILLLSLTLFYSFPVFAQPQEASSIDYSIQRAAELADSKQKEAQKKQAMINQLFNKGRGAYASRRYKDAADYFQQILDIDPSYEPAKLFLEGAIIRIEISREYGTINSLKLQMADIIAEYDNRCNRVHSLAVKYFLEKAQQKCQIGDYKGAEEFYNICYKINPYAKDKIEWFVKATHDLAKLSNELDEHSRRIEELTVFEP
ncbi:MAG: hypothetical protein HQ572_01915 [Candidatus Omnitrophica bacterium]|nr:hypothetical protein [Candidatus Omnitrophota bacterium]